MSNDKFVDNILSLYRLYLYLYVCIFRVLLQMFIVLLQSLETNEETQQLLCESGREMCWIDSKLNETPVCSFA